MRTGKNTQTEAQHKGDRRMRTRRIDVEGPNGEATITRDGMMIEIAGSKLLKAIETKGGKTAVVKVTFTRRTSAMRQEQIEKAARDLQEALDGFRGCAGDVASYRMAIELFAD